MDIGIDIVNIKRIKKILERYGDRFFNKIFSDEEGGLFKKRKTAYESIAGRFAAKEAFMKAKGGYLSWRDIKILQSRGRPYIDYHGRIYNGLSISHERDYAVAMVVIYEGSEKAV